MMRIAQRAFNYMVSTPRVEGAASDDSSGCGVILRAVHRVSSASNCALPATLEACATGDPHAPEANPAVDVSTPRAALSAWLDYPAFHLRGHAEIVLQALLAHDTSLLSMISGVSVQRRQEGGAYNRRAPYLELAIDVIVERSAQAHKWVQVFVPGAVALADANRVLADLSTRLTRAHANIAVRRVEFEHTLPRFSGGSAYNVVRRSSMRLKLAWDDAANMHQLACLLMQIARSAHENGAFAEACHAEVWLYKVVEQAANSGPDELLDMAVADWREAFAPYLLRAKQLCDAAPLFA